MSIDCKATAKIIKHVSDCFRKTRHICQAENVINRQKFFLNIKDFFTFFQILTKSGNSLHLFIVQFTPWKNIIFYLHFSDVEVLVLTLELIFIVIDVFISVFWWQFSLISNLSFDLRFIKNIFFRIVSFPNIQLITFLQKDFLFDLCSFSKFLQNNWNRISLLACNVHGRENKWENQVKQKRNEIEM